MPLLVIALLLFVLVLTATHHAHRRYQRGLARAQRLRAPYAHTGAEMARLFLDSEDLADVTIVPHQGLVTDYFDSRRRRLFLSRRVHDSDSLAAWAVALHEAAHALQARDAPGDLRWRQTCIRLSRYAPTFLGLMVLSLSVLKVVPFRLGLLIFAAACVVLFLLNAGTLAIEWNANLRLRRFLEHHLARHEEALGHLEKLLPLVATRELGDLGRSPRFFFLSALPGTSKIRPQSSPARTPQPAMEPPAADDGPNPPPPTSAPE
jgi:Zn-dependent membrane protease YugP